jgi:hypothetical protein
MTPVHSILGDDGKVPSSVLPEGVGVGTASSWFIGEGTPPEPMGVDGDFYIDVTTLNLYQKAGGTWL